MASVMRLLQVQSPQIRCWSSCALLLQFLLLCVAPNHNSLTATAFSFASSTGSTRQRTGSSSASVVIMHDTAPTHIFGVALTREKGKNDKLLKELLLTDDLSARIQTVCLPCIGHTTGPDEDALQPALEEFDWDWIAVTSPEAARVLAVAWDPVFSTESKSKERQRPSVCAVGTATCETLAELGIDVAFVPSKATAKTLVKELPSGSGQPGQTQTVLYPASAQAAKTLQEGLTARGFVVTRLDTYDTLPTTWTGAEQSMASNVHVACFASPSAVTGWLENQKTGNNKSVLAACIGETSAAACRLQGFPQENVFFPDKPGLAGWVAAVRAAVDSLEVAEQLAEQSAHP